MKPRTHIGKLVRRALVARLVVPARFLVLALLLFGAARLWAQQPAPFYPAGRVGGNHMFSYYYPPAPSSTPWAPSWSPDGRWIAISMSGSLWKVDPRTGVAEELTYDERYHSSPEWSPDGRWIVFTTDDGGKTIQLAVLNVATGAISQLTSDGGIYLEPRFSADGTKLAYVAPRPNGNFNVYVRPIRDGQWAGEELAITHDNRYGPREFPAGEWDMHISPAWMPDGQDLLLVSNRMVPLGSGNIVRVPVIANAMMQARTILAEHSYYRPKPDVSKDGKRFVYSSTRGAADQYNNLYVQPTGGGEPYKLTFFAHDAFQPRWSPDGEWIAYISNERGLPGLALLETYGGAQRDVPIVERRWKRPTGVLSVRTIDSQSGHVTPARTHLTAADGKFYAPSDAYTVVSRAGDRLFQHDGSFQVTLPVGRTTVTTVKGFEFTPATIAIDIKPNEETSASVQLERIANMTAKGWFNGSTHVHMNWGGNLHQTIPNTIMVSKAEGQDVLGLQVVNQNTRILDHHHFVKGGGPHPASTPDQLVVMGQEYRPPFYGHVFMFGMRDHLISPFMTAYEGTAVDSLYPSNTDMLRKAKAQGATVGYVHAFTGETDPLEGTLGGAKGFIVDAALGATDAVEWSAAMRAGFFPLYAIWNNGLRMPATGGEDSVTNEHHNQLAGATRTYVFTGKAGLDMDAWFAGIRAGRSFVTSGPLVELTLNGRLPGDTLDLPSGSGAVQLEAIVRSITPLERVWLVSNGRDVAELPLSADRRSVDVRRPIQVNASGWYHLRAEGRPEDRFPLDAAYPQAFTNPIWVTVAGQPIRSRAAAEYCLKWIEKLHQMAEAFPHWRSPDEKARVYAQFEEARRIYQGFSSEVSSTGPGPAR